MVVCGGSNSGQYLNDVWLFDAEGVNWTRVKIVSNPSDGEAEPAPRSKHASVAFSKNAMLVHGGTTGLFRESDLWLFYFLPRSNYSEGKWIKLSIVNMHAQSNSVNGSSNFVIPVPRDSHSISLVNNELWMFGGSGKGTYFNDIWKLQLESVHYVLKEQIVLHSPMATLSKGNRPTTEVMNLLENNNLNPDEFITRISEALKQEKRLSPVRSNQNSPSRTSPSKALYTANRRNSTPSTSSSHAITNNSSSTLTNMGQMLPLAFSPEKQYQPAVSNGNGPSTAMVQQLEDQRIEIAQLKFRNSELNNRVTMLEDQLQRFFKLFDQHSKDVTNKIEIMQHEESKKALAFAEYIVKQEDTIDALDRVINQEVKARIACDTRVSPTKCVN